QVARPIVRLRRGEGARARPAAGALPLREVLLEARARLAVVLLDLDPHLAHRLADVLPLGRPLLAHDDLAGDHRRLLDHRLLAAPASPVAPRVAAAWGIAAPVAPPMPPRARSQPARYSSRRSSQRAAPVPAASCARRRSGSASSNCRPAYRPSCAAR